MKVVSKLPDELAGEEIKQPKIGMNNQFVTNLGSFAAHGGTGKP